MACGWYEDHASARGPYRLVDVVYGSFSGSPGFTAPTLCRLSGGSSSEICRQAKHDLPDDRRAGSAGSDVGESSLGVRNAGSPRAFERSDRRQCEPLLPEVRSHRRERAPHLSVVSRPEREGDEAEAREADIDLVEVELEGTRDRSCLLLRDLGHRPIAAGSRPRLVTQARRFCAGFVAPRPVAAGFPT